MTLNVSGLADTKLATEGCKCSGLPDTRNTSFAPGRKRDDGANDGMICVDVR